MKLFKRICVVVFSVLSTIATILSIKNYFDLKDSNFMISSLTNRPIITVIDPPKILSVRYLLDKKGLNKYFAQPNGVQDSSLLACTLNVETSITLKNIGTSSASIIFMCFRDFPSGKDKIRDIIENEDLNNTAPKLYDSFYVYRQLKPFDSFSYKFKKNIYFVKNDTTVFHYLFYYCNEIGSLFDTYYWGRFVINDVDFYYTNGYSEKNKKVYRIVYSNPDSSRNSIKFIDFNEQSMSYQRDVSLKLVKKIEKLFK
jgi:hypothetical protein